MAGRAGRCPGPCPDRQRGPRRLGPARPGSDPAARPPALPPAGPEAAAPRGQLRAPARRGRAARGRHPRGRAGRAGGRHEPGAAVHHRRARHPDPAAGAASRAGRRDPRPAPPQRVGRALHRAGRGGIGAVRADHVQPDGGRGPVPAARRSAPRDRARGGQDAGPLRGADRRVAWRTGSACSREEVARPCRATRRCGPPSSGATTSWDGRSGSCSGACPHSRAGSPWTMSRRCARSTTCRRRPSWT